MRVLLAAIVVAMATGENWPMVYRRPSSEDAMADAECAGWKEGGGVSVVRGGGNVLSQRCRRLWALEVLEADVFAGGHTGPAAASCA